MLIFSSTVFAGDRYVDELLGTFNSNPARFDSKYRGTGISGTGQISEINSDSLRNGLRYYIVMKVNGSEIQCNVTDRGVAADLNKGETVKFNGTVERFGLFNQLILINCNFERLNINNGNANLIKKNVFNFIPAEKIKQCPENLELSNDQNLIDLRGTRGVSLWTNSRTGEIIFYNFNFSKKQVTTSEIDPQDIDFTPTNTCFLKGSINVSNSSAALICENKNGLINCEGENKKKLQAPKINKPISSSSALTVVKNFYEALAKGDGAAANLYLIPEKRYKNAFDVEKMNSFYGKMERKIHITSISANDNEFVTVDFEYAIKTKKCIGRALVKLKKIEEDQYLIEKINSNC